MKKVNVLDKEFGEFITEEEIGERLDAMAELINSEYSGKEPLLISVLNGAFIFTADLIRRINFDPEVHFVRVSSYGNDTSSSGKVRQLLGLDTEIENRHLLVIEDIVDTGHTIEWLKKELNVGKPASLKVVTLLFKKEAFQYQIEPDYVGFSIPNDFVLGYGLDYAQRGRFLRSIYKLTQG